MLKQRLLDLLGSQESHISFYTYVHHYGSRVYHHDGQVQSICAILLQASVLSFEGQYDVTDIEGLHRGIYSTSFVLAIITLAVQTTILILACRSAFALPQWSNFDDSRLTHTLVGSLSGTLLSYMLFVLAVSGWSFLGAVLLGLSVLGVVAWRIGREMKSRRKTNVQGLDAV